MKIFFIVMKTFKFTYERLLITVELGLCRFEPFPMSVRAYPYVSSSGVENWIEDEVCLCLDSAQNDRLLST